MKATSPDMKETASQYFYKNNLMDVRVISPIGLTDTDVYQINAIPGVESVMPSRFADGLLEVDGKGLVDIDGSAFTCRAISMNFDMARNFTEKNENDSDYINRLTLKSGTYPKEANQCLVDESALSTPEEFQIGSTIKLTGDRENLSSKLVVTEFTIVGIIETPTYISFERGNTLIGSGKLGSFIYVSDDAFAMDYYTELYVTVKGANTRDPYSEEYFEYVQPVIDKIEEVSKSRIPARAASLSIELTPKIMDGRTELAAKELEAEQALADAREQIREVKKAAEEGEALLAEKVAEYEASLTQAQKDLMNGKTEYNDGLKEYNENLAKYLAAKKIADENPNAINEYNDAVEKLAAAKADIEKAKEDIASTENLINLAESGISAVGENNVTAELIARLEDSGMDPSVIEAVKKMTAVGLVDEALSTLLPALDTYKTRLADGKKELAAAELEYAKNERLLKSKEGDIKKLQTLNDALAELRAAEQKLSSGQTGLSVGEMTLSMKQLQLKSEIEAQQANIEKAKAALPTIDEEYIKKEAEVKLELQNARYEIENAENLLKSLDTAEWMITNRSGLPGYDGWGQTADNMAALGVVFPLFFFLVAALMSLTTMARMVEEERVQLGTLKALGYSSGAIAAKYLIYALLASLLGSIIGLCIGFVVFPTAIFAAYGIMYTLPDIILDFNVQYAVTGTIIAVLSTCAATMIACRKELFICPAQLMRPKAPKPGKRVLLEKITFIWKRLNFTSKVTVRNIFRNKRRLIMTVLGIAGCSALLLASFGLGDSIGAIMTYQYGDGGISMFDAQLVLKDPQDPDEESEILTTLKSDVRFDEVMLTYMKVLNGSSDNNPDELMEINIFVPQQPEMLSDYIKLQDRRSGEKAELTDKGVLITEKFANHCNAKAGDKIFIELSNGKKVYVDVAGVVENYTFHYVYMTRDYYEKTFSEEPQLNYVVGKLSESIKSLKGDQLTSEKGKLATDLMKLSDINAVVYTTQVVDTFANIIKSLSYVVLAFIISAGALAFVVLYNLSNININERVREVATIKVLGFYDNEVSAYIYRENIFLTVFGALLGLPLGLLLHQFMISVAEVNVVMFGRSIEPMSYVYALLITFGFATFVNLLMHKKLKFVSMVESLKSVE